MLDSIKASDKIDWDFLDAILQAKLSNQKSKIGYMLVSLIQISLLFSVANLKAKFKLLQETYDK